MQGFLSGAGRGVRTHDLRFTKPLLYQLSYAGNTNQFRLVGLFNFYYVFHGSVRLIIHELFSLPSYEYAYHR